MFVSPYIIGTILIAQKTEDTNRLKNHHLLLEKALITKGSMPEDEELIWL